MVAVDIPSTAVCYAILAELKTQERKEQSSFTRKRRVKRKAVAFHSWIHLQLGSDTERWRGLRQQGGCGGQKKCTFWGDGTALYQQ